VSTNLVFVLLFHVHIFGKLPLFSLSDSHSLTTSGLLRLHILATCFNTCSRERTVSSALPLLRWSCSNLSKIIAVSSSVWAGVVVIWAGVVIPA